MPHNDSTHPDADGDAAPHVPDPGPMHDADATAPPLHAPAAPPTAPVGQAPAERAVWPTVLGVIMIVFGAGGVLTYLWGAIANFFMSQWISDPAGTNPHEVVAVFERWMIPMGLMGLVNAAVAALLLAAGIAMLRRRPWAIGASTTWAWLKIVITAIAVVMQALMQQQQFQAMNASGDAIFPDGMIVAMLIAIVLFGIAWGWALPIFLLIWMRLDRAKREYRTWSSGSAANPYADAAWSAEKRG